MKRIKIIFLSFLAICIVAWFLTGDYLGVTQGYFTFRAEFIQLTGLIALGAMSIDLILALRPIWIENILNGLDKNYRLHKWLGITAFVMAILHFLLAKGTKWAVGWGWLTRPMRSASSLQIPEKTTLELLFSGWKKNAEFLGEWAFYIMVILCIIALFKFFPYRFFRNFHTIFVGVYLVVAFHAIVLTQYDYWTQPFGFIVLFLVASGSVSAVVVLLRRIGFRKQYAGVISHIEKNETTNTLSLTVEFCDKWPGHQAGQFAFITLDKKEGAHPFTIASPWKDTESSVTFIIKGLGDYTNTLKNRVAKKQNVKIEGPYGRFSFQGKKRQIWIGAGIGITPFLARLKELQYAPQRTQNISFIYTVSAITQKMREALQTLAQEAGVHLTIWVTPQDGRLDGKRLREIIPDWNQAGIWFCGPAVFGKNLEKDMKAHGLKNQQFHRELFDMR